MLIDIISTVEPYRFILIIHFLNFYFVDPLTYLLFASTQILSYLWCQLSDNLTIIIEPLFLFFLYIFLVIIIIIILFLFQLVLNLLQFLMPLLTLNIHFPFFFQPNSILFFILLNNLLFNLLHKLTVTFFTLHFSNHLSQYHIYQLITQHPYLLFITNILKPQWLANRVIYHNWILKLLILQFRWILKKLNISFCKPKLTASSLIKSIITSLHYLFVLTINPFLQLHLMMLITFRTNLLILIHSLYNLLLTFLLYF